MQNINATLKIAHIVRRFVFDEWGGTEAVVWNTALQQKAQGLEVEILATSALASPGEELRQGIRIRRFPYWYPYFPMDAKTRLTLDKKGGNPFCPKLFHALRNSSHDLVHIHTGGRLATLCARIAKDLGIPSVLTLHGGLNVVPPTELQQMMAPTKGRLHYGGLLDRLRGLRNGALPAVDAVICLSNAEKQALAEKHPKQRSVYLPNGVNVNEFTEKPSVSARAQWNIPQDKQLLLCLSRIDYQKNQLLLLEALAALPQTHLLMLGPVTSQEYLQRIKERAAELQVADRLTVIPGVAHNSPLLRAILHEADIFVLPSLHEPFGIVVLEAWAAGLPVVAARTGGLADFISNEQNGLLFTQKAPEELTSCLHKLLEDKELRERLIGNARQAVAQYDWSKCAAQLWELYRELRK